MRKCSLKCVSKSPQRLGLEFGLEIRHVRCSSLLENPPAKRQKKVRSASPDWDTDLANSDSDSDSDDEL